MRLRRWLPACALISALAVAGSAAAAADLGDLYPKSVLERERDRLAPRVEEILDRAFWPALEPEERRRLERVRLRFPLVGVTRSPVDFYTGYLPESEAYEVHMPVLSLLFFEDLCTAVAWFWANGHALDVVDDYVAMLRYRQARDIPGGRHPAPLEALPVPANALADPAVDGLSLRFRNSGYAFILAHELGHALFRHPGYGPDVQRADARANEAEADRFALELMMRTSTVPMGALLYFMAAVHAAPNRWDFASEAEWEDWLEREATHPVTAERLRSLAGELGRNARYFTRHEPDPRAGLELVEFIASGFGQIAGFLEDQDLYLAVAERVRRLGPDVPLQLR